MKKDGIWRERQLIYIKDINFDVCYCSPLKRQKKRQRFYLRDGNIPIIFDDRLKEMSFWKIWREQRAVFRQRNSIRQRTVRLIYYFRHLKNTFPPKDGESFEDLYKRTGEFFERRG